jgi:hypothetical protein
VAIGAAVLIGRERLAWLAVPVFWPFTQWYYAAMALPAVTPLAAMALATPVAGATTVALVIAVVELYMRGRKTGSQTLLRWRPTVETAAARAQPPSFIARHRVP